MMHVLPKLFFLLGIVAFLYSCEERMLNESAEFQGEPGELVLVALKNSNEYIHDFQICGIEEGASIITEPKHAATSEIIRDAGSDWCVTYKYKAKEGFVGNDFVEIETCTGGIGTSCDEKEIVRIEFTVFEKGEERSESFIADNYLEDAKQLYFHEVINDSAHINFDNPILDASGVNEILKIIQAVYDSDSPQRDTIFEEYEIHLPKCYSFNSIVVTGNSHLPEIKNLANSVMPTGNAALDEILATYHFDSVGVYDNRILENPYLTLYSAQEHNMIPIEQAFRNVPEILMADFDKYCIGDGDQISLERNSEFATITFSIGRGDCPSGCIYRKFWEFRVVGNKARFIKSYISGFP